jgi:hypothetical protein
MLWYPVEGDNKTRTAPDVMVVFGRPKGDRGSYQQWREGGIAPQVVFEILSPGNTRKEMREKLDFYTWYGVEEYYLYDPERGYLNGWLRRRIRILDPIVGMQGWRSPRLGVRFELEAGELSLFYPDGRPFLTFLELNRARQQAESRALRERLRAQQEQERAERANALAQREQRRADYECEQAQQAREQAAHQRLRAEQADAQAKRERERAEQEATARRLAEEKAARLTARLKALGLDPNGEGQPEA